MSPVAEPAGDIRSQLAAVLDAEHPKLACFVVPANRPDIPKIRAGLRRVDHDEGTLLTTREPLARLFQAYGPGDDEVMAHILGYPEPKGVVVSRCRGMPHLVARAVQARDEWDHVVTEAYCSPVGFFATVEAMRQHVPAGGSLAVLGPIHAVGRRIALRWIGF